MKRFIQLFGALLILSIIIVVSIPKKEIKDNVNKISAPTETSDLCLIIENDCLILKKGKKIIKSYDVSISVLPSEDILLLSNGIEVKDVSEADEIAENFDG